jgi:hypothetical protein
LRLDLARMFIGKRAVPAGVGMNLRAVEPDRRMSRALLKFEERALLFKSYAASAI